MEPRKSYPSDIGPEQFERIRPLLESVRKRTKPRTVDLHEDFNTLLYLLKSGCQWRMLLICKRHLGDRIVVSSGGSDVHWNDPRRFCFVHLGYRLNEFTIVRDLGLIPTEQAGRDFNPNLEPLL